MTTEDQKIYQSIKRGEESGLIQLYKQHRQEFIGWAWQHFKMEGDDAADVFQDTIIILRRNIISGKLVELTSSLKTYLFAIGKNTALSKMKSNRKWYTNPEVLQNQQDGQDLVVNKLELSERQLWIKNLMASLGEPCLSILRLFYYQSFSMEAIARELGYKNENVVKSQKLRCIKALKDKVQKKQQQSIE